MALPYTPQRTGDVGVDRNLDFLLKTLNSTQASIPSYSDWTQFTMSISAVTSPPVQGTASLSMPLYKRVGDTLYVKYDLIQTTAGTAGSGVYLFNLPNSTNSSAGLQIDPYKSPIATQSQLGVVGFGGITDGVTPLSLQVLVYSQYAVSLKTINAAPTDVSSATYPFSNASLTISFYYQVPILGWGQ